jgi:hypothetical protein
MGWMGKPGEGRAIMRIAAREEAPLDSLRPPDRIRRVSDPNCELSLQFFAAKAEQPAILPA